MLSYFLSAPVWSLHVRDLIYERKTPGKIAMRQVLSKEEQRCETDQN